MKTKYLYVLGAVLLAAFAGYAMASFSKSLTPYLSYDDARAAENRVVQVAGGLETQSSAYDYEEEALRFTLTDPESEQTLRVRYHGIKPANFEDAVSIVAIGSFDHDTGEFAADKLLVKCPSKYQGTEVKEYS
jgi:cytochrome c-type biogenesis protein CcmE